MPSRKQLIESLWAEEKNAADVFLNVVPTFLAPLFREAADALEQDLGVIRKQRDEELRERAQKFVATWVSPDGQVSGTQAHEFVRAMIAYIFEEINDA